LRAHPDNEEIVVFITIDHAVICNVGTMLDRAIVTITIRDADQHHRLLWRG
jgi:hypothetical protein